MQHNPTQHRPHLLRWNVDQGEDVGIVHTEPENEEWSHWIAVRPLLDPEKDKIFASLTILRGRTPHHSDSRGSDPGVQKEHTERDGADVQE